MFAMQTIKISNSSRIQIFGLDEKELVAHYNYLQYTLSTILLTQGYKGRTGIYKLIVIDDRL